MGEAVSPKRKKSMPTKSQEFARIEGLPVRNLKKPIMLHITGEDCRKASTKAPGSCAAALAARRLPHITEARIHIGRIFLKVGERYWLRGKTPGALRTEIVSFDRGGNFEPGSYKINPLSKSELPHGKHGGGKDKTNRNSRRGIKKRKAPKILHSIRNNAHTEYRYK
jgi:hypothetical protein